MVGSPSLVCFNWPNLESARRVRKSAEAIIRPGRRNYRVRQVLWAQRYHCLTIISIVAIHGLAPERPSFTIEETWTCGDKLWLRDFLPSRLPHARILLFGYDSDQAFKASINGVRSHAEDLLERLRSIRQVRCSRAGIWWC